MKIKTILILFLSMFALLSCEDNDINPNFTRYNFLVIGDTNNCNYIDYSPDLIFNSPLDSFDIDSDNVYDIKFIIDDIFIDNCDEFFENCEPEELCDCWPTIYTDYIIKLNQNIEIAIKPDSTCYKFDIGDTLSFKNQWSDHLKYSFYQRKPGTEDLEQIIGIRKAINNDTLLAWVTLKINNEGIIIDESSIQK